MGAGSGRVRSFPLLEQERDPAKRQGLRLLWDTLQSLREDQEDRLAAVVEELGALQAALAGLTPTTPAATTPTAVPSTPSTPSTVTLVQVPAVAGGGKSPMAAVSSPAGALGVVKTAVDYVLQPGDQVVLADTTPGNLVVHLPGAASSAGRLVWAKNIGANAVNLQPVEGELVDGATALTLLPGVWASVVCDGQAWYQVGG